MHGYAVGAGKGDDIGEVVFALGVVAGKAAQPAGEVCIGQNENAGVGFADGLLLGRGVFFFHNGSHLAVGLADDAAQPEGVGRDVGE